MQLGFLNTDTQNLRKPKINTKPTKEKAERVTGRTRFGVGAPETSRTLRHNVMKTQKKVPRANGCFSFASH